MTPNMQAQNRYKPAGQQTPAMALTPPVAQQQPSSAGPPQAMPTPSPATGNLGAPMQPTMPGQQQNMIRQRLSPQRRP